MQNSDRRSPSDFRLSLAECAAAFARLDEAIGGGSSRLERARRERLERLYGVVVRDIPAPEGFGVVRYWWRRLCGQEF